MFGILDFKYEFSDNFNFEDVGRSCILVTIGGKNIMFDCGMHMGYNDEVLYCENVCLQLHRYRWLNGYLGWGGSWKDPKLKTAQKKTKKNWRIKTYIKINNSLIHKDYVHRETMLTVFIVSLNIGKRKHINCSWFKLLSWWNADQFRLVEKSFQWRAVSLPYKGVFGQVEAIAENYFYFSGAISGFSAVPCRRWSLGRSGILWLPLASHVVWNMACDCRYDFRRLVKLFQD